MKILNDFEVLVGWFLVVLAASSVARSQTVLVEAEQFAELGGWVNDSQFMDQMGSPFLLAHGLGEPVADATTTVSLPKQGVYRVWVRTRDWVAPWNAPGDPGRFMLLVNGEPLPTLFGDERADWHWQDGGRVTLRDRPTVSLGLHDLTGFEGRCDAIVLTSDLDFVPPNAEPELSVFRRKLLGLPDVPTDARTFDFVVVGGGIAGTCAALSAARLGLSVALVQDRPVLGGNNSSEVRVWLNGERNVPPWPRVGDIVAELEQKRRAHYGPNNTAELYEDDRKLGLAQTEKNVTLFLRHRANDVEMDQGRIAAVVAQNTVTAHRVRIGGRWFADCTGDGCIGFLAGADFEMTVPGHMGRCNLWNVIETDSPQRFPRCLWALDLTTKPFPGRGNGKPNTDRLGGWYWESGFDHDPIENGEYIRDWNFRAMYGAWDALKNVDNVLPNHRLNWAAHISGPRESRRLLGDVILTEDDVLTGKEYPDGCVPTGWHIDLHIPDERYVEGFEGDAFISKAVYTRYKPPYWIPYRCLYSRNVANLFMAGRDISVTHESLGTARVMRTGGCMGEIVGMAAFLCKEHGTDARGVYRDHLDELQDLMCRGVGKSSPPDAPTLTNIGANIALDSQVTTSGDRDTSTAPPSLVNDGKADWRRNDLRWLSRAEVPNWVEFRWPESQTITAARILSGYNTGGEVEAPIESFVVQYFEDDVWRDIPGTDTSDNEAIDWQQRFDPVTAQRMRLLVRKTNIQVSRIWEIELYAPAK